MWSQPDKPNKLIRLFCFLTSLCVALCAPIPSFAQSSPSTDLCRSTDVAFVFFNGVQTTPAQAEAALQELAKLYGTTSPSGDTIRYEFFYNYSRGFEDFVEVAEQRLLEQDELLAGRIELIFEAKREEDSWWDVIIREVPLLNDILSGILDRYLAQIAEVVTAGFQDPPTHLDYREHELRLDQLILEGKKLLFVAHSQGNLFANVAYDYAREKIGAESVKVVHIAPASPTLRSDDNKYVLAEGDSVIGPLRLVGSFREFTDKIPSYSRRPAGVNGKRDFLGHGLLEIYLNQALAPSVRVTALIKDALNTLVAPPAVAASGFFSATLTWDGRGDVDLHIFEPGGSHVFYRAFKGISGFLDVDNVNGIGPEHYFASCDSTVLLPGTYRIAVANYDRADGRIATVQIASWSDGVLGTKSVTLGGATGDNPSSTLFDVVVSKEAQTGKYSVFLGQ